MVNQKFCTNVFGYFVLQFTQHSNLKNRVNRFPLPFCEPKTSMAKLLEYIGAATLINIILYYPLMEIVCPSDTVHFQKCLEENNSNNFHIRLIYIVNFLVTFCVNHRLRIVSTSRQL